MLRENGEYYGGMAPCGYTVASFLLTSDVVQHARIDLDQQGFARVLKALKWGKALALYERGQHSRKSTGLRTLQGFSTATRAIKAAAPLYQPFVRYYDSVTYADDFVRAALLGTGPFVGKPDVMQEGSANKGSVYGSSWMYVVLELKDAIADCRTERLANNDMGVDALDEASAFYVGSLEGSDGSGSGVQPSSSAEKRCQNFRTCSGADGISEEATANQILRQHFEVLRGQLSSGLSDEAWTTVMGIVQQRALPMMQGMLRYAYKADAANGIGGPKEIAEGWAFAGGVLPQIHSCSPSAAALVRRHTDMSAAVAVADRYWAVERAAESVYGYQGISCVAVGGLLDEHHVNAYYPCMEPCHGPLVGHTAAMNVTEQAHIHLDQGAVEKFVDASPPQWSQALDICRLGAHSQNSQGLRTLAVCSTWISAGKADALLYQQFVSHCKSATYADEFVRGALGGSVEVAQAADVMRAECASKGSQYGNTWMYVILEMEDALDDWRAGGLQANDCGVHARDEAWVLYAGSLEGVAGCRAGVQPFALVEKRCVDFGTCTGASGVSDTSQMNRQLLQLFQEGQGLLAAGRCDEAASVYTQISQTMAVPMMQGMLRYAYKADPVHGISVPKEIAEGWAFARGVLPPIHGCDANAAALVRRNMDISVATPVAVGYRAVKQAVESVYGCMGISCADVGGMLRENGEYYGGMAPCGYTVASFLLTSDVVQHARIDLDQQGFARVLKALKWGKALALYERGQHSRKSTGLRTLQGFSTATRAIKAAAPLYQPFVRYYDSVTYADDFVRAALLGTGPFVGKPDVMQEGSANKGSVYGSSWMYVVLELKDAIADCRTERLANNDMGVDALDEASAFYVGSLEGSDGSGSGVQPSSSAEKRCQNFRTCSGADGISEEATANQILRQHFEVLRGQLSSGLSDEAWTTVMGIVQQRAVPVMQGMLRYAYKADAANGIGGPKEIAEGWAFAGGVLSQIHSCSPSAASASGVSKLHWLYPQLSSVLPKFCHASWVPNPADCGDVEQNPGPAPSGGSEPFSFGFGNFVLRSQDVDDDWRRQLRAVRSHRRHPILTREEGFHFCPSCLDVVPNLGPDDQDQPQHCMYWAPPKGHLLAELTVPVRTQGQAMERAVQFYWVPADDASRRVVLRNVLRAVAVFVPGAGYATNPQGQSHAILCVDAEDNIILGLVLAQVGHPQYFFARSIYVDSIFSPVQGLGRLLTEVAGVVSVLRNHRNLPAGFEPYRSAFMGGVEAPMSPAFRRLKVNVDLPELWIKMQVALPDIVATLREGTHASVLAGELELVQGICLLEMLGFSYGSAP